MNLYIILKGLVFLIHVHKIRNLQTHTKCSHFRFIYKQWVPLTPRKLKFPSLESMLFKQSLIWTNVWESGSYPHFRSSQKGWGGIRNLNRNSCETVKVGSGSVAGAACALSRCSPVSCWAPRTAQCFPGSCRNPMQDSDGGLILSGDAASFKGWRWHKEWSLNPSSASGCLGALPIVADKGRRRGLHLVKLDFCCGTEHYRS